MEATNQLLNLPFATLVALGLGYIGYRVAYVGHDGAHGPTDVIFISLVFAAIAKGVMMLAPNLPYPMALLALALVFGTAAFWRVRVAPWLLSCFRSAGLSNHDRGRTVWESMLMRQNLPGVTQLRVKLKDGRELMCNDVGQFKNEPTGACLFGSDGSIAMHVTRSRDPDEEDWTVEDAVVTDPVWGREMTFIPAAEISRIRVRRK